jgi:hypothetical protein
LLSIVFAVYILQAALILGGIMARPTIKNRLIIAKDDIEKLFDGLGSKCFDLKTITRILNENRTFWRLGKISRVAFIDFLIEISNLKYMEGCFALRDCSFFKA